MVKARVPVRADLKSKRVESMGCLCGANVSITETLKPGALLGAIDLVRVEFRKLHTEPGCTDRKAR